MHQDQFPLHLTGRVRVEFHFYQTFVNNSRKVQPPARSDTKARGRSILPYQVDDEERKTPEGFDLKKFMEENEQKNKEITEKQEGELPWLTQ